MRHTEKAILLSLALIASLGACSPGKPASDSEASRVELSTAREKSEERASDSAAAEAGSESKESKSEETKSEDTKSEESKSEESKSEEAKSEESPAAPESAAIEAKLVPEDWQAAEGDLLVGADESQYAVRVEVSVSKPVHDVEVLAIELVNAPSEGALEFRPIRVVYTLEELAPKKPLIVQTAFPGTIPNLAISYRDADGSSRAYAFSLSGKDGSAELTEIKLAQ